MTSEQILKDLKLTYDKRQEQAIEVLLDAVAESYKYITGKDMPDLMKERVWEAIKDGE